VGKLKQKSLVVGLHTFGLGDVVMAMPAILTYASVLKDVGVEFEVLVTDSTALEYCSLAQAPCSCGTTKEFLFKILEARLRGKKVYSFKTAGGTSWKNALIRKVLKCFGVKFVSESSGKYLPLDNYNFRAQENLRILNETTKEMYELVGEEEALFHDSKRYQYLLPLENKIAQMHPSIPECLPPQRLGIVNTIAFHFGAGDTLSKELSEESINEIVSLYRKEYPESDSILIIGPRDKIYNLGSINSLEIRGGEESLSIKELVDMSKHTDLLVCNDTGIGHIFSAEGVAVDLFTNKKNMARLQHVLPPTIENLVLI